ncbi:MAG: MaoC domain-containing protein dehydratase [Erysipelotrichaceae bacterium]|nr:MAG: MaoC domain-containing protein [Erysipelotrichaceae bacterium]TXT19029.1 MAG: MaoC domain-containing protein dehydratase [Erysipelotrichaceae bacterium]
MNNFTLSELQVGQKAQFTSIVSKTDFASFLAHSHDTNPLHNDDEFAQAQGYPSRVAYGMLTASYFSTLAGVYLPGLYALIHTVNIKFVKPVYEGDELTIIGEIVEKNETFSFIELKANIKNQHGTIVCKAQMQIGVLK